MKELQANLEGREAIALYLQAEFPFLEDLSVLSPHVGGRAAGLAQLQAFKIEKYSQQKRSGSVDKFVAELAWQAFFHFVHEGEGDRSKIPARGRFKKSSPFPRVRETERSERLVREI